MTTAASVVIDYGQQLIDLVAESNCRANQVSALMQDLYGRTDGRPTKDEWDRVKDPLQAAFIPYATSLSTLQTSLSQTTWPADARTAIADLIATVSGYADYAQKISVAATFEEFSAIPQPPQSNASATVRKRLGLQPQDVDGIDYCEIAGIAD